MTDAIREHARPCCGVAVKRDGRDEVTQLTVSEESLHGLVRRTRLAFGELCNSLNSTPVGSAYLWHVRNRHRVNLNHQQIAVRDQSGVRPPHRVQNAFWSPIGAFDYSVGECSLNQFKGSLQGRNKKFLFPRKELEDVGSRDLCVLGNSSDRSAQIPRFGKNRNRALDDRDASFVGSG